MKQILADITPMGSNNLFVTHYWPDKQTDPPLHYHEDYMLCLTLHVRGQRIMDDAVEDFTEKDLVLINPGTPHRFKRDAAYADAKCETATVMFSREMPDWKFLSLEHMRPIREMLLRPAAGLRFAPKTIDTVLERMISLPKLDGFEAVSLFFSILNDLATAPPDEVQQIVRVTTVPTRTTGAPNRPVRGGELFPQTLAGGDRPFGGHVPVVGVPLLQTPHAPEPVGIHQQLPHQPGRAAHRRDAAPHFGNRPPLGGFTNVSNFNHLFRAHLGTTPSDYRSRFKTSPLTPDTTNWKRGAPFIRRRLFFTIRADQRTSTFQGEYIRTPCWFRASRTVLYSFIISPSSERAKASRTLTFSEAMIAAKPVGSSFTSTTR